MGLLGTYDPMFVRKIFYLFRWVKRKFDITSKLLQYIRDCQGKKLQNFFIYLKYEHNTFYFIYFALARRYSIMIHHFYLTKEEKSNQFYLLDFCLLPKGACEII